MKSNFLKLMLISILLAFMSGCSGGNFFDIQSVMNAPENSSEQDNLRNSVKEYMGESFIWKYPLLEGKYSPILKTDIINNGKYIEVVFCGISDEINQVHILFLKWEESGYKVYEDIDFRTVDIKNVFFDDINSDGKKELIIFAQNEDEDSESIYAYRFDEDCISKTEIPENILKKLKMKK